MTHIYDRLNGKLRLDWREDGLICDITVEI
jgi:hypothetical protein